MKQAILLVMAIALGLAPGCAGPNGGADTVSMAGDEGPQMRMPSPDAPAYVPGQEPDGTSYGATAEDIAYRFNVGDGVVIHISGITPSYSVEDVIDEKGLISMPYIGQVKVAGVTASELEEKVHSAYVPDYYKFATISVFVPSRVYYIRGEVRSPGRYPIAPGMTILQAISVAGGYTDYASKKVQILRGGKPVKVNLKDIERNPEKDILLKAQDQIIVPRALL